MEICFFEIRTHSCFDRKYYISYIIPGETTWNISLQVSYYYFFKYPTYVIDHFLFFYSFSQHFGEFGQYSMNASSERCGDMELNVPPANIYLRKDTRCHKVLCAPNNWIFCFYFLALLWASLCIFFLFIVLGLKCIMQERYNPCYLSWFCSSSTSEASLLIPDSSAQQANPIRYRIRCLDTFRG